MGQPNETTLCQHRKSCFLLLPAELRNKIYYLVLIDSINIDMRSKKPTSREELGEQYRRTDKDDQNRVRTSLSACPALPTGPPRFAFLRTCKQVYIEGYKIYYGCNTFSFDPQAFYDFFERPDHSDPRVTDEIKRACIYLYQFPIDAQLAELSVYSKIERLQFFLPEHIRGVEGYSCALPKDILRFPHLNVVALSRWSIARVGNLTPVSKSEQDIRYQKEANELLLQRYISSSKQPRPLST